MYSVTTRLDSAAQGGWTREAVEAEAVRRGAVRLDDLRRYLDAVYGQNVLNPEIVAIQSAHETGWWTSYWWEQRLNPAGIGITGDPNQNNASRIFATGVAAARAHLVHLALYAIGTVLPAGLPGDKDDDPRWANAVAAGYAGQKRTIGSLTNTWAIDSAYGDKLVAILNQRPATTQEPAPMGYQKVRFVGLDRDVYLPDNITVHIDIVPSRITNVRSNQRFTGQTKTTFHDTGDPGSTARSQRNYLHNGAEGRSVGYNFAVDDKEIWQLTPLDEVTWAAGTPEGNRTSWHVEQCYGGSINWDASLRNAIALHAGLIAAKGWSTDTALVKHQYWYGKWCPAQVLNKGIWSSVVSRVSQGALAAAAAANGGTIPPTAPVYATPVPIPELAAFDGKNDSEIPYRIDGNGWVALAVFDRVKALKDTPRLRYSSGTEMVGGPVKAGEEFDVDWLLISTDFPDTYLTPWLTRIRAADTARVSDVKAS